MSKFIILFGLLFNSPLISECHYLLMGAPGSGKGTFSQFMLKQKPEIYAHLCMGDLLRDEIEKQTLIGQQIQAQVESGKLVETEIVFSVLREAMCKKLEEGKYIILDGLVQSQENIDLFDALMVELNLQNQFRYVYFSLPKDLAWRRMESRIVCVNCGKIMQQLEDQPVFCSECGGRCETRRDDNKNAIEKRLARFYEKIEPLIVQYKIRPDFFEFDGCKELQEKLDEYSGCFLNGS